MSLEQNRVSPPLLSIVISTKNRLPRLKTMLASLREQTYPSPEIIIIDDGSEPPLPPFEASRLARNETSLGMCAARNRGFDLARGKYVVVLDDDTVLPDPTLLARAVEVAEQWPRLGAIAFRQLTAEGKPHYLQPALGEKLCFASHFFGYGFLVSREAIKSVGPFYAAFGYYHEEIELGFRLLDAGYAILYDPSLGVIHYEETANRNYRVIHRINFRNSMCTVILRYPLWLIVPGLLRCTLRYVKLTWSWKIFSLSDLLWAFSSLIRMGPRLLRDRKPVRYKTLRSARAANQGLIALQPDSRELTSPLS